MSEHDRGAYAPPTADAPLSFDARHPVRGARPFPVTLIMTGLVLVGLIVAIALIYRSGVREAGQAPKTIGEPVAEMKSPAPADAQPQDPATGLQIYKSDQGRGAAPSFVPPPEQPAPRPAPAPVAEAPAAAPTTPVQSGPALRPALPPAPPPAPAPAAKAPPAKPPAVKPPAPAPAPAVKGGAAVQIGAVSTAALADKAWKEAVAVAPNLAAGKGKGVERIEKGGQTLYRTAVTGFASREDAAAFCAKLKAAGKACFVK